MASDTDALQSVGRTKAPSHIWVIGDCRPPRLRCWSCLPRRATPGLTASHGLLDDGPIMRHTILLFCWLAFSGSVRAEKPTPVPKPEVRQSVRQLSQSSESAKRTLSKRTNVKDSHDRHATVEKPLPSPSPKRTVTNRVSAVVGPSPRSKTEVSRNAVANQKPTPSPAPRSKVKTSDKQHDAMQRYLRE